MRKKYNFDDLDKEDKELHIKLVNLTFDAMKELEKKDKEALESLPLKFKMVKPEIKKTIERELKKERRRKYPVAIACIVLCFVITIATAVNADALKEHWFRFWGEIKNDHDVITLQETVSDTEFIKKQLPGWNDFYYPELIPKDFVIVPDECTDEKGVKTILFRKNEHEYICFFQSEGDTIKEQLDNEIETREEIPINNYPGIYIKEKNNISELNWTNGEKMWFKIASHGDLNKKELIKMADSLIYIK